MEDQMEHEIETGVTGEGTVNREQLVSLLLGSSNLDWGFTFLSKSPV